MSVRSLAELDTGSGDGSAALAVHEEVARALHGIVSAEELPVPSSLSKRQLRHLRSRSTSQGSIIEAVTTASPATIARFQRASSIAVCGRSVPCRMLHCGGWGCGWG
jgi:hypothetical protein